VKTQKRPLDIVFGPDKFSIEVGGLLTERYRPQGHSKSSYAVFEGDFCGGNAAEFSHSLGRGCVKTILNFSQVGRRCIIRPVSSYVDH
jgi:hypothetical protein